MAARRQQRHTHLLRTRTPNIKTKGDDVFEAQLFFLACGAETTVRIYNICVLHAPGTHTPCIYLLSAGVSTVFVGVGSGNGKYAFFS